MNVALTLRCDGRSEYVGHTIATLSLAHPDFSHRIIVNDSGDPDYAAWLEASFPEFAFVHHPVREGLGACFRSALIAAVATRADFAFMVEDDTPLIGDVDLAAMANVLQPRTNLAQIMLMRPAFNAEEIAAGGVYQLTPDAFTEHTDGEHTWVEHQKWYGYQPHLVSRIVMQHMLDNPSDYLELGVTGVLKPAAYRFAYWGGLSDPPLCDHVGHSRSTGYRW